MSCIRGWHVGAGCWQKVSVPSHGDLFIGLPEFPPGLAADFPRVNDPRKKETEPHVFFVLASEITHCHFLNILLSTHRSTAANVRWTYIKLSSSGDISDAACHMPLGWHVAFSHSTFLQRGPALSSSDLTHTQIFRDKHVLQTLKAILY